MDIGSWERIGHTWKGLVALIAVAGMAFTAGMVLMRFDGLPDRVATVEEEMSRLRQDYRTDVRQLKIDMQSLARDIQLANCLQLADRRGMNWRECVGS